MEKIIIYNFIVWKKRSSRNFIEQKLVFHKVFVIKSMAKPLLLYSRNWQKMLIIVFNSMENNVSCYFISIFDL